MICSFTAVNAENVNSYDDLFGEKELLSYFLLTDDIKMKGDLERFLIELDIQDSQLEKLYEIAYEERNNSTLYSKNEISEKELEDRYDEIDSELSQTLDNYEEYKVWMADWYNNDI